MAACRCFATASFNLCMQALNQCQQMVINLVQALCEQHMGLSEAVAVLTCAVLPPYLQAAQEREELQASGDVLDAKITQCEAEVRCRQCARWIQRSSIS